MLLGSPEKTNTECHDIIANMNTKSSNSLNEAEKDYLFDLNGYLIIDDALSSQQLEAVDHWLEQQPQDVANGDWVGNVQIHGYGGNDGRNYQNIIEGGEVFEELMDSPKWFPLVRRYIESDYNQVSMVENFLNVRGPGGFLELHSGGHTRAPIMTFRHKTGNWNVGQINILMALTDIGPDDGATILVPGSHKSNELHPFFSDSESSTYDTKKRPPDQALGAEVMTLKRGQALMFTDSVTHGGSERKAAGNRKVMIYRYSPHHIIPRFNYVPSKDFVERLTPQRRALVESVPAARYSPNGKYSSASLP